MVPAAGLEPVQAFRPYGSSYHFDFRRRPTQDVCGLDYTFTVPSPLPPKNERPVVAQPGSVPNGEFRAESGDSPNGEDGQPKSDVERGATQSG